jgi:hypothetical protein
MKRWIVAAAVLAAMIGHPTRGEAQAADGSDDRLTLMAQGSTLTGTDGGGAASIGWLHNFNANTILGVAGQYQYVGGARWKYGSLTLAHGIGQSGTRSTFYAEAHQGSGSDHVHSYDYSIYAAGLVQSFTKQLSLQIEDKELEIDTVRGNLPKIGLTYFWGPTFSSTVSYAHSVTGNIDTRLTSVRVDSYGKTANLIAGMATGQVSPVVIDVITGDSPSVVAHEYFLGVTKPFSRADLTLLADYLRLASSERFTLTLNCTVHLRRPGASR